MSQASRSKVFARERHIGQVIALIVSRGFADGLYGYFDVHAARDLGERLVAFERFEGAEQVVADWRESKGLRAGVPPGFPHDALRWRQHVRLGRRLLEAIKGQPSWCKTCGGLGSIDPLGLEPFYLWASKPCSGCSGTGHNLRGKLPKGRLAHYRPPHVTGPATSN